LDGAQDVIDGGDGNDFAKVDGIVDPSGMVTDKSLDVVTTVESVKSFF
jgi:hypothetical protein